jgi:biofilm protein TabA
MAIVFHTGDIQRCRETVLSNPVWKTVLDWLSKLPFEIEEGEYDVDKALNIKATIRQFNFPTDQPTRRTLEAHEKNIDVHFCLDGTEYIKFASSGSLQVTEKYNEDTDTLFLYPPSDMHTAIMTSETIAIFFPEDAHLPLQQVPSRSYVRKVVIKIPLTALR